MKRSKINLIVNREDYQKYQSYFTLLKVADIVLFTIFIVIFLMFFVSNLANGREIDSLNRQKKTLLASIKNRNSDEARINYIQKKYQDLKLFLKDDANSSPYYSLLSSALDESTESAMLKSFLINKNREVSFTISFNNFDKLMGFLKFVESENFLSNFEEISLKSFDVVGQNEIKDENYELSFVGKFVPLNNEK